MRSTITRRVVVSDNAATRDTMRAAAAAAASASGRRPPTAPPPPPAASTGGGSASSSSSPSNASGSPSSSASAARPGAAASAAAAANPNVTAGDLPKRPSPYMPRQRNMVSPEEAKKLFLPLQLRTWPRGYYPSRSAAHFLRPEGVPLGELVGARRDLRNDQRHELQRDLAMDFQLWCRGAFDSFAGSLDEHDQTVFRRVMSRGSLPDYEDVVGLFRLPSISDLRIEEESTVLPGIDSTPKARERVIARRVAVEQLKRDLLERAAANNNKSKEKKEKQVAATLSSSSSSSTNNSSTSTSATVPYPFTSYAQTQDVVLAPIQQCRSLMDPVRFLELPSLRNLLHLHHDSCSHLRYLTFKTLDEIYLSQQLVEALASYLRRRWEQLPSDADKRKPILMLFGNGRLGAALNASGMLPVPVVSTRPSNASLRRTGSQRGQIDLPSSVRTPRTFAATFDVETLGVSQSLQKHAPALVVMEPHMDRDYTAEARGYYTVREVLMLGRVDGPGMASFTYPWLSFGCAPSVDTYWLVNEKMQIQDVPDGKEFMPADAPHVAQGYEKLYIDSVSRWLVGSNDTPRLPHQYRCVSFRRTEIPPDPFATAAAAAKPANK